MELKVFFLEIVHPDLDSGKVWGFSIFSFCTPPGEISGLSLLSFTISNILQSILNFSLDTFDSLVQVSYAQDKSAHVSFNFQNFTQKAYIYSIHISGEEINDIDLVENLASREADAPIYSKLGFSYGKAVHFKKEFGSKQKSDNSACPSSPAPKPTMAAMSTYTPEMRQVYLSK